MLFIQNLKIEDTRNCKNESIIMIRVLFFARQFILEVFKAKHFYLRKSSLEEKFKVDTFYHNIPIGQNE